MPLPPRAIAILSTIRARALESPFRTATLLLVASWLLIRPWGDFPLNDDWTYAHLAKHTAETGRLVIDVPIAPNAVGQALLGAAVVKVVGFSHTALRLITLLVGLFGLWAVDALLAHVTARNGLRLWALLVLGFSPIYYYSAASFMNELYGWVPPLLAAVLWHWDRRRQEARDPRGVITPWVAAAVGLTIGLAFWTRQFGVLVFPALLLGTAGRLAVERRWRDILRGLPAVALGLALYGAGIYGFFAWAKATGNLRPEFTVRAAQLWHVDGRTWLMQSGSALVYLTAFFLPWLVLFRWTARRRWLLDGCAAALLLLALMARAEFHQSAPSDFWIGPIWSHKVFPYIVNIVWNAGLGPVTLDDAFFYDGPKPGWPRGVWASVEVVLLAALLLWAAAGRSLLGRLRPSASPSARGLEVVLFGAALCLICLPAIIQSHQGEMVDRYYLPLILGAAIFLPGVVAWALEAPESPEEGREVSATPYAWGRSSVAFAALALFSVLGAHDQFRWNEARWELVRVAMEQGGTRATVQGGWEVNCWFRHEGIPPEERQCVGGCGCALQGFCCVDDRWRIGMSVSRGYSVVAALRPSYWLAEGPPVVLSRRAVTGEPPR